MPDATHRKTSQVPEDAKIQPVELSMVKMSCDALVDGLSRRRQPLSVR
jgi:hypothetical protein